MMMKKALAALAMCLMAGTAMAYDNTPGVTEAENGSISYNFQMADGRYIHVVTPDRGNEKPKYLEIRAENGVTYRIYPCGQLEKLMWKELNPNEDKSTLQTWRGPSVTIPTTDMGDVNAYVAH